MTSGAETDADPLSRSVPRPHVFAAAGLLLYTMTGNAVACSQHAPEPCIPILLTQWQTSSSRPQAADTCRATYCLLSATCLLQCVDRFCLPLSLAGCWSLVARCYTEWTAKILHHACLISEVCSYWSLIMAQTNTFMIFLLIAPTVPSWGQSASGSYRSALPPLCSMLHSSCQCACAFQSTLVGFRFRRMGPPIPPIWRNHPSLVKT